MTEEENNIEISERAVDTGVRNIAVPHSFFRKERDDIYNDWTTALWREFLQNSGDAGAKAVRVTIKKRDREKSTNEYRTEIAFQDNGKGMDRAVLEDVFFAMGETTKKGEDTTGGFGRARILLCFAQERYRIMTKNLIADGVGGQYSIKSNDKDVKGCTFQIIAADRYFDADDLRISLDRVLARCNLPFKVYLADQEAPLPTQWVRGRKVRDLSARDRDGEVREFASVWVNKSGSSQGTVSVRVNGLWMFDMTVPNAPQVTIEINPKFSKDVLRANRDELAREYRNEVMRFVSELSVDTRSAVKEKKESRTGLRDIGGMQCSVLPPEFRLPGGAATLREAFEAGKTREGSISAMETSADEGFAPAVAARPLGLSGEVVAADDALRQVRDELGDGARVEDIATALEESVASSHRQEGETPEEASARVAGLVAQDMLSEVRLRPLDEHSLVENSELSASSDRSLSSSRIPAVADPATLLWVVKQKYPDGLPDGVSLRWRRGGYPSVYIDDESQSAEFRRGSKLHDPESWVDTLRWVNGELRYEREGLQAEKTLRMWATACRHAVGAHARSQSIGKTIWVPGFYFGEPDHDGSSTGARCAPIEGGQALLLNPMDSKGRARYKLDDRASRKRLIALAKHEAAHLSVSWHNENYAAVLTDIDTLMDDQRCDKAMRDEAKVSDYSEVIDYLRSAGPAPARLAETSDSSPSLDNESEVSHRQ